MIWEGGVGRFQPFGLLLFCGGVVASVAWPLCLPLGTSGATLTQFLYANALALVAVAVVMVQLLLLVLLGCCASLCVGTSVVALALAVLVAVVMLQ